MEQGTAEWLQWRKEGIGASESAALMGVCPYKTPLMLWKEKLKGEIEDQSESANVFAKGHAIEAQMRAAYEFETGLDFPPCLMEYSEWPVVRASLDGWNEENRQGIEIKFVGQDKLQAAIPAHHVTQMQHQMLVAGVKEWTYIRSTDGVHYNAVKVEADVKMQMDILSACMKFWDLVEHQVEPEYTDRDWFPDERPELVSAVELMREATTTKVRQAHRDTILALCQRKRTVCQGVKISKDPDRVTFPKVTT